VGSNKVPAYVTAYEHFNEHRSILKMTTGSANLDSLIDSIQEGQFYLFYGSNKAVLDGLVHGLLVNCVLPKQKHGFESMVLYINNTDYYQPDKSKVFLGESSIDKEIGNGELKSPRQEGSTRSTRPYR
jgi:hypothetical protein